MRTPAEANNDYVLKKLQCGQNAIEMWCKHWNIKMNKDKTWAVYFSHRRRPSEVHLTLNGRNIPFVNHVKYLNVIFNNRIIWRLHIEMIEAKAFRTIPGVYSLFKSEQLSANNKLTPHTALIRSVIIYSFTAWESAAGTHLLKLWCLQNKDLHTTAKFSKCVMIHELHMAF
jgi:hypothetical protein